MHSNAAKLLSLTQAQLDDQIFRFKPARHPDPKENRTWVWRLIPSLTVELEFLRPVISLTKIRLDALGIAHQYSRDGPLVQAMVGKGKEKSDSKTTDAMGVDSDGQEGRAKAARKRGQ